MPTSDDTPPRPTPAEISELLRTMPQPDDSAAKREAWMQAKRALIARIEATTT